MTKDGFTLLAFGYTGKKAMQFKIAYINAFNEMEQALRKEQKSKEKQYFKRKRELYRIKHSLETENKSIWDRFYNSTNGKDLLRNKAELKQVKAEIADMDRKQFGYTHNLFSLLENKNKQPYSLTQ